MTDLKIKAISGIGVLMSGQERVDSSGSLVAEKDWQKCEAFAKIIARAPSTKGVPVESYYESIAPQIV